MPDDLFPLIRPFRSRENHLLMRRSRSGDAAAAVSAVGRPACSAAGTRVERTTKIGTARRSSYSSFLDPFSLPPTPRAMPRRPSLSSASLEAEVRRDCMRHFAPRFKRVCSIIFHSYLSPHVQRHNGKEGGRVVITHFPDISSVLCQEQLARHEDDAYRPFPLLPCCFHNLNRYLI